MNTVHNDEIDDKDDHHHNEIAYYEWNAYDMANNVSS